MGAYKFVASSVAVFLIMNAAFVYFPSIIQDSTGIDTSSLQQETDVSGDVNTNVTQTNSLDRAGDLASIYTKPDTSNRALTGLWIIYIFIMSLVIFDMGWIG